MLPFSATGVREKNKKEGKERISRKWGKKGAIKGDGKSQQKNKRERSEENAKWERRGGEMEETASFSATDVRCAARQWLDEEEQETVGSL